MAKFNFSEAIKKAEVEYGLESGGYFKVKEGGNKIRIMSDLIGHQSSFKGTPNFKFVCWVYDYRDFKIKLFFMPMTIARALDSFQKSDDYAFEEMPMPYDVTINATGAGTKEVKYQLVAARANTVVPIEASEQLAKKEPIESVIVKLKENEARKPQDEQAESRPEYHEQPAPETEIDVSGIPFG